MSIVMDIAIAPRPVATVVAIGGMAIAAVGGVLLGPVASWVQSMRITIAALGVVEVAVAVTERTVAKRVPGAVVTEITTNIVLVVVVVFTATSAARVALRFIFWNSTVVAVFRNFFDFLCTSVRARAFARPGISVGIECDARARG